MAAYTKLADGTVLRWHVAVFAECRWAECPERHVTKAELNDFSEERP